MTSGGKGGSSPERLADVAFTMRANGAPSSCAKTTPRAAPRARAQDPACRAARADDEHAAVGNDQSEVVAQVAHQAGAVGVVAEDAVAARRERVHRRGVRGP